jgi:GT2 family glycosyltransferase
VAPHPSPGPLPALSVVLVTRATFDDVRETVASLRAQTVRSALELVLAAPDARGLRPDERALAGFHSWRVAEIEGPVTPGLGLAAGVRVASAPLVAFAEEHSFPEPGWAEALVRAHRGPWAVVGPAIVNANPGSRVADADYLLTHGSFGPAPAAHEADEVPAHNSSFKRAVLLGLDDDLEPMLEAETVLWWRLRAAGHRLCFEPAARTRHLSVDAPRDWLTGRFDQSRVFGAARGRAWPRWRRLVYAAGSPLIPPLRLWRLLRALGRREHARGNVARALPLLAVGLVAEAVGEAVGYVAGAGGAPTRLARQELDRRAFVRGPAAPAAGDPRGTGR